MDLQTQSWKILVTGASSGIGRGIAIKLSRDGHQLICHGRDETRLRETLSMLHGEGHSCEVNDLENIENVEAWGKFLLTKYGLIQGFVHAAGIQQTIPLQLLKAASIERMLRINVTSSILLIKTLTKPRELAAEGGAIVFISSVMGQVGQPGYSLYSLCKGAVDSAVRSLALELANKKVRVNSVAPGCVKTPMLDGMFSKLSEGQVTDLIQKHALGLGEVEDVANIVSYLISPQGKWITGSTFNVDGGYTAQ
jgi:NAD(P)-dependent dehydrogenase (short-subunit alcohol dehydrogenase family)